MKELDLEFKNLHHRPRWDNNNNNNLLLLITFFLHLGRCLLMAIEVFSDKGV